MPKFELYSMRRRFAENTSNTFYPNRVEILGPDLSCLEWLMECGATSIKMSDGNEITRIKEMKEYIHSHGFNLKKLPKIIKPMPPITPKLLMDDEKFEQRWAHIPQVFIDEIDGSDAGISNEGFNYFIECRQIKKIKFNHCDYFTNDAIKLLSLGRTAKTLEDFEVCMNPWLSDAMVPSLIKMKRLKRLHFYFLPYVSNRAAVVRQLKVHLPRCKVTFPELDKVGYGYEN
uniref:Mitochondrial ATP synthase regulatory component factor B n=1 Tax=Panagrolaimus sp. PS1159 TaxID=55785 RepID=A0AC35FRP9_9BILA